VRRRAGLLLALLLVGGVVAVGAVAGGLPQPAPVRPEPGEPTSSPSGVQRAAVVLSVDLTASGTVWLTTAGVDCDGCVVVWRRGRGSDEWLPLRQVGSAHLPGQVRMNDASIAGLIGGGGLWSTQDGGDSWTQETSVPIRPGDTVQVAVSDTDWWALVRSVSGPPLLWNAAIGGRWREVGLPAGELDPEAAPVVDSGSLLVWGAGPDGPRPVSTVDGGRSWQTVEAPCRTGTTTAYATCSTRRGLQLLVRERGAWETWPLAAALGPARNLSPVAAADSVATNAQGIGYAVVRGNLLVTQDRGLGGWSLVE
jgi:hypothetical protein